MKATEQYFLAVLLICRARWFKHFKPVDKIPKCGLSNENCIAVLSCGCVPAQGGFKF